MYLGMYGLGFHVALSKIIQQAWFGTGGHKCEWDHEFTANIFEV